MIRFAAPASRDSAHPMVMASDEFFMLFNNSLRVRHNYAKGLGQDNKADAWILSARMMPRPQSVPWE
jgi:hypothetical protein